jgi:SAM-dependent methyltransferase
MMADDAVGDDAGWRPSPVMTRIPALWRKATSSWSRAASEAAARAIEAPPSAVATPLPLELDPLTIKQWLYGRGYVIPGDASHVLKLVEPFELGSGSTMLDLAAGLGGPARAVAQAFHARVTGLERDPDLVRRGTALSTAQGLARLARFKTCDPESVELEPESFDCALGREASYMVVEKERYLRVVVQSLKPRGQLVLTDFVRDRAAQAHETVGAWAAVQPRRPVLWSLAQYTDCLKSLGFHLRAAEDMTASYRRQILAAWIALLRSNELRRLKPGQVATVLHEAEASLRAVAAFESGGLRYYRMEAIAHWSFW